MRSAVSSLRGKSNKWYFEKAMEAMSGATDTDWIVRISPHIGVRQGALVADGHRAILSYCIGIFAMPIHVFGPEDSAVLRAQHIYWKMVCKLGNGPKENKGGFK